MNGLQISVLALMTPYHLVGPNFAEQRFFLFDNRRRRTGRHIRAFCYLPLDYLLLDEFALAELFVGEQLWGVTGRSARDVDEVVHWKRGG